MNDLNPGKLKKSKSWQIKKIQIITGAFFIEQPIQSKFPQLLYYNSIMDSNMLSRRISSLNSFRNQDRIECWTCENIRNFRNFTYFLADSWMFEYCKNILLFQKLMDQIFKVHLSHEYIPQKCTPISNFSRTKD